jgi:hypothetical protein
MKAEHASVLSANQRQIDLVHAETEKLLAASGAEVKASIESAKGTFSAIRGEVKTSLEAQQQAWKQTTEGHFKELRMVLAQFQGEMNTAIAKINAEALQTVAVRLTQVCVRAEKAIGVLQQLILDTEKSPHFDGGPEDYAPETSPFGGPPSFYGRSQTAKMDDEVDMVQEAQQFTESPAEV